MVLVGWMAPWASGGGTSSWCAGSATRVLLVGGRERGPLKHLFLVLHRVHHAIIAWGRVLPH